MTSWPTIISSLQVAHGRAGLARLVGAGASTLADLATGKTKEPRHTLGVKLLKLHAKADGRKQVRSG